MNKVIVLAAVLILSFSAFAQNPSTNFDLTNYGVRIEPDKRVMTVLAALEAAGVDTPLSAEGEKFRARLKNDLLGLSPDLRRKLVVFVEQYKRRYPKATSAELVAPFVSMAYSLAPAPEFTDPPRAADLPGDLLDVLDFAPLVREFYRASLESNPENVAVRTKIDEYFKDYQNAGAALRPSAIAMVGELLDYLHTRPQLSYIENIKTESKDAKGKKTLTKTESRVRQRQFYIVPEMLAPKGTINFVNVRDNYYAIVPPNTDLSQSEVRRAYLQFVIDPIVLSNAKDVATMRAGIKSLLGEQRTRNVEVSPDVFLAVTRSLVAAAEARQIEFEKISIATAQARQKIDRMKTVEEKKAVSADLDAFKKTAEDETAAQLYEAYEKGAVLAFYFSNQLKGLEDSGFDIAGSMREFILSLDPTKETNRLAEYSEARKRGLAAREERRKNNSQEFVVENPVTQKLLEIDALTKSKNYAESDKQLKQLLAANSSDARIYYALGRVASLSAESITDTNQRNNRLLEAKKYFSNVIGAATPTRDPALLSLSYVALARIYEYFSDYGYAVKIYEAAIKIGRVKEGAFDEAVAAHERLIKQQ